jgi:hypothetical protein
MVSAFTADATFMGGEEEDCGMDFEMTKRSSLMKARGGKVLFGSIVATLMALTTALTASAAVPKLAHRWSFNGDYADSIGGTTATMIGSAVGFNEGNTAVVMSGAGYGAGSLNLGVDMLPTDVPEVTVEMWFTHNGIKNWARLFDFGQNNQNYFTLTLCQGADGKDRIEIKKANTTLFATDNSMTPYVVGTPYHVSITFKAFSDGATEIRWMRRDVTTGAIEHAGSVIVPNWTIGSITSPNCFIGHSQYTGDHDANATYDEFRVWKGILSDAQLTASVLAGPDALPDTGASVIVNWTGAVDDDATNAANWSPSAPDATKIARFSGDFAAQIPSDAAFACAGVLFDDARLTADCDWRGLSSKIDGGTLDLGGNKLYVSALDGSGTITSAEGTDGELHIDVPSGATSVNEGVAISGAVKVFKEGAGSFTAKGRMTNTGVGKFIAGTLNITGNRFIVDGLDGSGTITAGSSVLKNHDFQTDVVADGAAVAMAPQGWLTSGTSYVLRNKRDMAHDQANGSNWCFINSGSSISQTFYVPIATMCSIRFTVGTKNNGSVQWKSNGNVKIDGANVVAWEGQTNLNTTRYGQKYLSAGYHTISIACTSNSGMAVDNIDLSVGSVLDVNVAEGMTSENNNVALTGAGLQVHKTGKGLLVMNKENTGFGIGGRYTGSTSMVVKDGTVKKSTVEGRGSCGAQYSTIKVENGGQVDLAGRTYWDYDYIIEGNGPDGSGALVNNTTVSSPWATSSNRGYLQRIALSGDATIGGTQPWALLFWNYGAEPVTLNGHTLTIAGTTVYSGNNYFNGSGRVVVADGAAYEAVNNSPTASDCDVEVNGTLAVRDRSLTPMKSLKFGADGKFSNSWDSDPLFVVYEEYAPPTMLLDKAQNVQLGADGHLDTALDLSLFADVFDGTALTFYPKTALTVKLGARTFTAETTKLVSWTAKPDLADLIADGENLDGIVLGMTDDGLYAYKLNADRPATARWTGNGNVSNLRDPANWNCFNLYGDALENMAPTNFTTVVVDGRTTFSIPEGVTDFPWKNIQFGSTSPAATQWGRISYGGERYKNSDYPDTSYVNIALGDYVARGTGDIANLNGQNTAWQASYLDCSQLRFDGWFFVTAAQAGSWHITQSYDDYFGFAVDGEWVVLNRTYTAKTETDCEISEGWHRFSIVCGDTWGGQGSRDVTVSSVKTPMAISINGGSAISFSAANFQMGSGSNVITLDGDCDWRALGRVHLVNGASVNLNGHKLKVANIDADADCLGSTVTSPLALDRTVTPPEVVNDAIFWLDASDASTLAVGSDGKVSTWTSKSSDGRVATASGVNPTYDTTTYGIPTVDFGDIASNKDMTYTRLTNIKTVFWVIKIEKAQRAFLLGDKNGGSGTYNFHRGTGGQYGNSSHAKFDHFWNGLYEVDWKNDYPEEDGFEVLCVKLTENCSSDSLTYDRGTGVDSGARNGGRQLSELICFSRDLSDAERITVTEYLQRKWKGKASGELHIEVPQGESLVFNGNVSLAGNVQLVKEGAGLLTQSTVVRHVGGTRVAEGEFDMGCSRGIGRRGEVTIDEGAVFNVKSYGGFDGHLFVLNGGTFRNTGSDVGSGTAQLKYMLLTTNSTLDIQNSYGFIGNGYTRSILDLGGYTLTVNLNSGGKLFYLYNTEVRNGVLDVTDGGWLETGNAGVTATDATIKCRAAMRANGAVDVRDYVAYRETSKSNEGTAAFKVYGTFTPMTDIFYGCQMQDGSTVDISGRETAWHTTTAADSSAKGSTTVTFADNATITVNIYGREGLFALTRATNPFVVTWDEEPANLAGLKFVTDAKSRKMGLRLVPDTKMVPAEEGQVEKKGLRLVYLGGSVFLLR